MKLKNEALEKLYDTIVNCTIAISPHADSSMDKAFKECDEKIQKDIDIWRRSNEILLSANAELAGEKRQLQQDHESDVRLIGKLHSQMVNLEDEKTEQEKRADILKSERDMLMKEIEQLKKDKERLEHSRLEWAKRAVDRGKELNEVKDKNQDLTKQFDELKSEYQKITIENKNLYEQGQTDLWEALQNVNDVKPWDISSFYPDVSSMDDIISWDMEDFLDEYKKWQEDIKKTYEQKETDRMREWLVDFCWGRVCEGCPLESKEYKCGCGYSFKMTDPSDTRIIPDKDIKRYYEKARGCGRYTLNMEETRKAISKACEGFRKAVRDADTKITENLRKGCTFEAEVNVNKDLFEKLCGMKSEEKKSKPGELVITTRGVTTANYTEATMNTIKEAVRKFEKSLPALDSWESTITGSIKVDDILGKANDPDHKFEYGDAVRVPWRNYDYMYIGPEKKHVRLFNPMTHEVVFVSPSEKLTYQGTKIILTDEEDLRKIWKDKK